MIGQNNILSSISNQSGAKIKPIVTWLIHVREFSRAHGCTLFFMCDWFIVFVALIKVITLVLIPRQTLENGFKFFMCKSLWSLPVIFVSFFTRPFVPYAITSRGCLLSARSLEATFSWVWSSRPGAENSFECQSRWCSVCSPKESHVTTVEWNSRSRG